MMYFPAANFFTASPNCSAGVPALSCDERDDGFQNSADNPQRHALASPSHPVVGNLLQIPPGRAGKLVAESHLAVERPANFLADAATRSFARFLSHRHCTLDNGLLRYL